MQKERPLSVAFVSYHAAFDPSNGAARSMRDLLHLLGAAGCTTASLTGPCIDTRGRGRAVVLDALASEGRYCVREDADADADPNLGGAGGGSDSLYATDDRGMPSLAYLPDVPNGPKPKAEHAAEFLRITTQLLQAMQPDIVLTYGGGAIGRAIVERARSAGSAVAFRISNLRYGMRDLFMETNGILVPAKYVAAEYARRLNLECMPIPSPLDWERTIAKVRKPHFLTYVAPAIEKGLPWAARILEELTARRPDIPLLVVEGRGSLVELARRLSPKARSGISMSRTVTDPRSFLSQTRVLLMPSYVEASGRLAQEAVLNEIPVIASDRGGLPETLAHAGIVLPIEPPFGETHPAMPPASSVRDWVSNVERMWDDKAAFAYETDRCAAAKLRWTPERLARDYLRYLHHLRPQKKVRRSPLTPMRALERARSFNNTNTNTNTNTITSSAALQLAPLSDLHVPE